MPEGATPFAAPSPDEGREAALRRGRRAFMRRAQAGDARAFAMLVECLAPCALEIARELVGTDARAQLVVEDAFLTMWRTRAAYDPDAGEVHAWAFGLVREHSRAALEPLGPDAAPGALPFAEREVIALARHGGLTYAEIARQLSLSAGTVKGRMRLGLDRLRSGIDAGLAS